jgi:hypothetical protein
MKRYWLEGCSIAGVILLPAGWCWAIVVEPAREAARRTQCKNHLWNFSLGYSSDSFRYDYVYLNEADEIKSVSPASLSTIAITVYHRPDGTLIEESELPLETAFKARVKLLSDKSNPHWLQRKNSLGSLYEYFLSHAS